MPAKEYDVLIIGSGASGGMAAYNLTKKGIKCCLLDAGPLVDFEKNRGLKPVYELPYRGFGKPGKLPTCFKPTSSTRTNGLTRRKSPTRTNRTIPSIGFASG